MRRELQEQIDAFLTERREGGSRYAPVTPEDIKQLNDILWGLICDKWTPDCDGDHPVSYHLTDKTKNESAFFFDIPHLDMDASEKEYLDYLDLVLTNLDIASEKAKLAMKMRQFHLKKDK